MYRLEERDFLLSRFREMQRFSLFSQPSLSLVEQSRFFRFTRTCDATREFIPSKTTKAGEESREVLSSSLGPNRGSPLYRKPKRLLREATSRVLDKTARLRATVSSYSFFSFLFFGKWRICAKRARKGKKLGIGGDPPLFLAFIGLQRRVAERVAHEKSNHLTLLPLMKLPRHARRKKQ